MISLRRLYTSVVSKPSTYSASNGKLLVKSRCFSLASTSQNKLTLSHDYGISRIPLKHMPIGQSLLETVNQNPEREALVFCEDGTRMNFTEFFSKVNELAAGFLRLGLKKGDRVGIWGPTSPEWVLTQFATARLGLILVTINPAYQTKEVEYALRKVQCSAIVTPATFKIQNYYNMLKEISPELDHSHPGFLSCERLPDLKHVILTDCDPLPGTFSFSQVLDMGSSQDLLSVEDICRKLSPDDAVNIQFTSGTTGNPKGATLTHYNIVNNSLMIGQEVFRTPQRICCQVPLYHCFGCVAGTLSMAVAGQTVVFPAAGYEPAATAASLQPEKCSMLYGTPTMWIDVCTIVEQAGKTAADFPDLEFGVIAGSPSPPEVIVNSEKQLGLKMLVAYGSTETSPVVTIMRVEDPYDKSISTVGKSMGHVENKVVDPDGNTLPVNTRGELCSRGFVVMKEYWEDAEKTEKAIDQDGWYHSGDLAYMDEEGFVKIAGRIKDMIIRGGENIYPAEVESFIHTHPKVENVQVFGIPSKRMVEEVAAWIQVKEGEELTVDEIKEYCKGHITHYKIPKYMKFVDAYPMTITRKIQKFKMTEMYSKELGVVE